MRMEQLEYLIAISKNRSLNSTAQKLHISQQALSISIKTLEGELGFAVLYRSYQGVSLTPKGAQLVKMTVNYLNKVERLKNYVPHPFTPLTGKWTVHSCYTGRIFFFPRLQRLFYEDAPTFQLTVTYAATTDLMEMVVQGQQEWIFCNQVLVNDTPLYSFDDSLSFIPLTSHKLYCHVPRIYPLAEHQSTSIKNLLNYPLIFYTDAPDEWDCSFYKVVNEFGRPKKPLFSTDATFCREMVDSSDFIEIFMDLPNQNPYHNLSKNCTTLVINDNIQIIFGYLYRHMPFTAETDQALLAFIHENLPRILEPF